MMSNINITVDEETRKEATEIFTKLGFGGHFFIIKY